MQPHYKPSKRLQKKPEIFEKQKYEFDTEIAQKDSEMHAITKEAKVLLNFFIYFTEDKTPRQVTSSIVAGTKQSEILQSKMHKMMKLYCLWETNNLPHLLSLETKSNAPMLSSKQMTTCRT